MKTKIDGLELYPLKIFQGPKGSVMHILKSTDEFFEKFGEVYISMTNPSEIKGWKNHKLLGQNFVVPQGQIKFVFFDDRKESPTRGQIETIEISPNNYQLIKVPAKLWYSFKATSTEPAMIINCTTHPHQKNECLEIPLDTQSIPFKWN